MDTTNTIRTGSDERSPLLPPDLDRETNCETGVGHGNDAKAVAASWRLTIIGICLLLMILLDVGLSLLSTGLLQVQEDIICQNLHAHTATPETCKDNDVQSELSIIQSWQIVFDLIPGLVMAVPLGIVADRYGRSLVLGLSLFGITMSYLFSTIVCSFPTVFPLRCIWLSALFNFIGGSVTVFSAMTFCIAADLSSEDQRSTAFFYLGAAMLGGVVISNPITYWVMERGTWLAIYLGLGMMAFTTLLGFCMPETLEKPEADDDAAMDAGNGVLNFRHLVQQAKSGAAQFRGFVYTVVKEEWRIGMLLFSLLLTTFGRNAQVMLQQYVVAKFKWSWSKAGLLLSVQAFCSLLLLIIFLPAIAQLLLKILPPPAKDLWLARVSMALQVAGTLTIGLADEPALLIPGVALQALGVGFNLVVRGIMTNLLGHEVGLLYSVIAFIETAGTMIANPLLAVAFRIGLGWGRSWTGLAFMVAAILFTGALIIVGMIAVPEKKPCASPGTLEQSVVSPTARSEEH